MKALLYTILAVLTIGMVSAIPSAGDTGIDNSYGSYAYKVCRADANSAWVSADNSGTYNAVTVCQSLGYNGVNDGQWGGTCGDVCGFCGNAGNEYYNGAGTLNGNPNYIRYTVHWQCGDYTGDDNGGNDVPEFGIIGATIVLIGAGLILARKRK